MLSVTARLFIPGEREILRRRACQFPWLTLWRDHEEIKAGMAEVISGLVSQVWSENGCRPPCCPNAYLIDTVIGARTGHREECLSKIFPKEHPLGRKMGQ